METGSIMCKASAQSIVLWLSGLMLLFVERGGRGGGQGGTTKGAQGSWLCSGITPDGLRVPYGVSGIEPRAAMYKANILPAILSLQPLHLHTSLPCDLFPALSLGKVEL